jgi:hypothetical protein
MNGFLRIRAASHVSLLVPLSGGAHAAKQMPIAVCMGTE